MFSPVWLFAWSSNFLELIALDMFFILFNLFYKFSILSNPLVSLESSSWAYVSDNVFILPFCLLILYVENFKFVWFSLIKSKPLNTESYRWIVWCWLKVFILDFSLFLLYGFLFIPDLLTFGDNVCKVSCILYSLCWAPVVQFPFEY